MKKNERQELLVVIKEKIEKDEPVNEKEVLIVSVEKDGYISPA
jgi:hypothetical protein